MDLTAVRISRKAGRDLGGVMVQRIAPAGPLVVFRALPDVFDGLGLVGELRLAGLGQRIGALAAFGFFGRDQVLVLKLLQGGVDAAGAGLVQTARAFLEQLDAR